jgi:hypothetical protein
MRTLQGVPGGAVAAPLPDAERAELERLRAENAEHRARNMAREAAEVAVAPIRDELARERRRREELEREAESDDGPGLDFDSPLGRQIAGMVISAIMKNPEPVMGVLSTVMQKMAQANAAPPPPSPNPAPPPLGTPQSSGHVHVTPAPNVSRETPARAPAPAVGVVQPFPQKKPADAPAAPVAGATSLRSEVSRPIQHDGAVHVATVVPSAEQSSAAE